MIPPPPYARCPREGLTRASWVPLMSVEEGPPGFAALRVQATGWADPSSKALLGR